MTPIFDPAFQAISHGFLGFALHGSFLNQFLIGQNFSAANMRPNSLKYAVIGAAMEKKMLATM